MLLKHKEDNRNSEDNLISEDETNKFSQNNFTILLKLLTH